jgi:hypothetical protein
MAAQDFTGIIYGMGNPLLDVSAGMRMCRAGICRSLAFASSFAYDVWNAAGSGAFSPGCVYSQMYVCMYMCMYVCVYI